MTPKVGSNDCGGGGSDTGHSGHSGHTRRMLLPGPSRLGWLVRQPISPLRLLNDRLSRLWIHGDSRL